MGRLGWALKYYNTDVVFQEIPDEVTLAINITNCPCRCPGCHSKFLWADRGKELNEAALDGFVREFGKDITCVSFMGGDADPAEVSRLAGYMHNRYPQFKTAWYTGKTVASNLMDMNNLDYIKIGPYIEHLGPLSSKTTNQRLYRVNSDSLEDITSWFWNKGLKVQN